MINSTKTYPYEPNYAVSPGEILEEHLDAIGMNQKELALRTGLTEQSIVRILQGEQPVTVNTANKLELVLGVPARMWNNLEALYRERLAKIAEKSLHESNIAWLKTVPWKELVKRKVVPNEKDKAALVKHVLAFFGVGNVEQFHAYWKQQLQSVAARKSQSFASELGPTSMWIRLGELQAHAIDTNPFDKKKFRQALYDIRALTNESPSSFEPKMRTLCADAGVALCFERGIAKAPWHGASRWLSPDKAMLLLSLRGKRDDQFWFSFFHEAGHILHDSKKEMFLNDGHSDDPSEQKANDFASEILIPKKHDKEIETFTTENELYKLADTLNIAPGIVAGRYQYLHGNFKKFNNLKRTLKWADGARATA